jgi:Cyclin
LTTVLLTSKFFNDVFYGNNFIAAMGGVSLQELNFLEAEFLALVNWRLWVEPTTEFEMYL